jgi:hypothetical protein
MRPGAEDSISGACSRAPLERATLMGTNADPSEAASPSQVAETDQRDADQDVRGKNPVTFDKYIKAYWLAITIGLICAGVSAAIVHEFASRTAGTVVGLIVGGTVAAILGRISAKRAARELKR